MSNGLHPDDRAEAEAAIQNALQGEKEFNPEFRVVHPDGTIRFLKAYALIQRNDLGEPQRMIGINYDITERKLAEQELIRNRDLREAIFNESADALFLVDPETLLTLDCNRRVVELFEAANKAELIGINGAILGMSEGFQEGVFGSINEGQRKAIATIERSGKHLLELINDILDLSKIESGKLELQISDVPVRSLSDASLAFVKQMALKKNIRLSTHISDNLSSIQVDDRRLRQVLINLLSNAVKFTPEGGSVKLEVRLEKAEGAGEAGGVGEAIASSLLPIPPSPHLPIPHPPSPHPPSPHLPISPSPHLPIPPHLCFCVIDTGIGIASEDIGKLFQPFIQLDSNLNRQYSGTGLGLALVQQIAALHGGTASVSSEVGQGSCFTVRIPYRASDRVATKQVKAPLPRHRLPVDNFQVLIIEDSIPASEQMTRYLSESGMQPVVYPRGEGAVEEVLRTQPALVILDLQLPNLSGWDVLAQLKTNPQTQKIPVVIISVVDERTQGMAGGAFEYLVKPITRAQIQATLEKLQHPARPDSPAAIAVPEPPVEPPLILLAEDNQANIDTISGYLESRGYRLMLAKNGKQAIDLALAQRPDLILMDIQMPEMDGVEAMRRIRNERHLVLCPIVALTALAMPGDRETCLAAGANEYLTKPVKLKQLTATIQQLLEG